MSRDYKLFLKDIIDAIKDIDSFVGDMDYENFLKDKKTQKAVVWQIHIIGDTPSADADTPLKRGETPLYPSKRGE